MSNEWVNVEVLKGQLANFFNDSKGDLTKFGSTINQIFEAFVLASIASWYKKNGWIVCAINPQSPDKDKQKFFRLKFSTRGRPSNYTYIKCSKGDRVIQIRHQLRVGTKFHKQENWPPANVCLDVAVIEPEDDIEFYSTKDHLDNTKLITFAEAKHMSAFAELVAGFIGLVHEIQPRRLKCIRRGMWLKSEQEHPAPFLYVSGILYHTAKGLKNTIIKRKYDIDIYSETEHLSAKMPLPKKDAPKKTKKD